MTVSSLRLIVAGAIVGSGLAVVSLASAQQALSNPNFIGTVTTMDAKDITAGKRRFEPGARTAWHSHDRGQLLYVESGHMRTQVRGKAIKDYGANESEYTAPNVEHWHGATPTDALVQVNIQFGGTTTWLEPPTEAEYTGKPKP